MFLLTDSLLSSMLETLKSANVGGNRGALLAVSRAASLALHLSHEQF